MISFFTSCTKDVFVCRIANSFERLLLHALSQYLDLLSHSKSPVVYLYREGLSLGNEGLAIAAACTLIKVYSIKEFHIYIPVSPLYVILQILNNCFYFLICQSLICNI